MFTGIVEAKGKLKTATAKNKGLLLSIAAPKGWTLRKGQSIAVDGVCLTVTKFSRGNFETFAMPETLRKTTLSSWKRTRALNLERALRAGDRLDGHLLQGHVAGTGRVKKVSKEGASLLIGIMLPKALIRRVALYGAVAIDGVSLTVARRSTMTVTVALIPYTRKITTLGTLRVGDVVNIEADFMGKRGRVGRNEAKRTRKGA
ncbi:MAG: riboflavin synthase [Minisyncoccia bacterium]